MDLCPNPFKIQPGVMEMVARAQKRSLRDFMKTNRTPLRKGRPPRNLSSRLADPVRSSEPDEFPPTPSGQPAADHSDTDAQSPIAGSQTDRVAGVNGYEEITPPAATEPVQPSELGRDLDEDSSEQVSLPFEQSSWERRERESTERVRQRQVAASTPTFPSEAVKKSIGLVKQLMDCKAEGIPNLKSVMAECMGALAGDETCPTSIMGQIATDFLNEAPEAYLGVIRTTVSRGLFFELCTRPMTVDSVERQLALARPAYMHELDLRSLVEIAQLDTAFASFVEYVRYTGTSKALSTARDPVDGKPGAMRARMAAIAGGYLKEFRSILQSLANRRRPTLRKLEVKTTSFNVLVNATADPTSMPVDGGGGDHGQ